MDSAESNRFINVTAASKYLGISTSTLNKLRVYGGGPVYIKLGRRVGYDPADLDMWRSANRRRSTSVAA
ncbi:DNA-binding protein [Rhodoplanes serenus]|uniref:DNA-binding protein n=1 Tax=Rhodoplanes serenus TaxID=200615 RepID=A0A9X4XK39_9BRAD|nr:DNA-binding protein [Rhodoplanes serenus]MTW16617.1 DNA-binding protein [Rhodoplanes serenus]